MPFSNLSEKPRSRSKMRSFPVQVRTMDAELNFNDIEVDHRWERMNLILPLGAVHKVRHAIFGQFWPSVTLCHTSRDPPKVRHTSRTPRFLVGLVQKTRTKAPCTNSLSRWGFCPGRFLSIPPSVRIHLLQQKVKDHFKFHVPYWYLLSTV